MQNQLQNFFKQFLVHVMTVCVLEKKLCISCRLLVFLFFFVEQYQYFPSCKSVSIAQRTGIWRLLV